METEDPLEAVIPATGLLSPGDVHAGGRCRAPLGSSLAQHAPAAGRKGPVPPVANWTWSNGRILLVSSVGKTRR